MIAEVLIELCKLVFGHPADELLKKHVLIVWGDPLRASLLQEFYFLESVHTIIISGFLIESVYLPKHSTLSHNLR